MISSQFWHKILLLMIRIVYCQLLFYHIVSKVDIAVQGCEALSKTAHF